jgi:hypothetical protein
MHQFDRWDKPMFFFAPGGVDEDIRSAIKAKYNSILKGFGMVPASSYSMDAAEDSDSSVHSQSSEDILSNYSCTLKDKQKTFESTLQSEQDLTIKAHLDLTKFCGSLLDKKILDGLFSISDNSSLNEITKIIDAFFGSLKQKGIKYKDEQLIAFFDSSYFPPIKKKSEVIKMLRKNLEPGEQQPKAKKAKTEKNTTSLLRFSGSYPPIPSPLDVSSSTNNPVTTSKKVDKKRKRL